MPRQVSPRYLFPLEVWDAGATHLTGDIGQPGLQYGPLEDFEPTGWDERKGFAELETATENPSGGYDVTGTELIAGNDGMDEIVGCDGTHEIVGDDGMNEIVGDDGTDEIVGFDPQTLALLGLGGLGAYLFYRHGHPGSRTVTVPSAIPGAPAEAVSVPQEVEAPPGDGGGGGGDGGGGGGGGGGGTPSGPTAPPPAAVMVTPGTSAQAAIQALQSVPPNTQIQVPAGAIPGIPTFTANTPANAISFIKTMNPTNDVQALRAALQSNQTIAGAQLTLLTRILTPEEASAKARATPLLMQAAMYASKAASAAKLGKASDAAAFAKQSADAKTQSEALANQWKSSFLSRTATMTTAGRRFRAAGQSVLRPVARVSGNVLVPAAKLPVAIVSGVLGTATHAVGNVFDVLSNALRGRF